MNTYNDVILFLNILKINNLRIRNFISEGLLNIFLDIKAENIDKLLFLNDNEKENIKYNFNKFNLEDYKYKLEIAGIKYITILDKNYPQRLRNIYDAPAIIYYKGNKKINFNNCLAVVGTRKPTEYGIWATKRIISELAGYDICIVSGMATGIDSYAHNTAIENNISTIGVLASSLEIRYPKSNNYLYDKMENELLISEFPLFTNPQKQNFVFRNRIISGISFGTLVIQAAEKSGSLITAKYAIEQNRDLFAVPGNINNVYSQGCNNFIKLGAKIVQSGKDIIEDIPFIKERNRINLVNNNYDFPKKYLDVINVLSGNILSINEISNLTKIDIKELYEIIFKLEMKNIVMNIKENFYTLN
ncbi:DNA-processing protein DprA [Helcococcus bovis]|uniref:DNA-processing protein DprA n=1 Tax=Helcococcus bovis TaxID=3153252 RepID=UPI0038BC65B6